MTSKKRYNGIAFRRRFEPNAVHFGRKSVTFIDLIKEMR